MQGVFQPYWVRLKIHSEPEEDKVISEGTTE